jgi:hypothetical protein
MARLADIDWADDRGFGRDVGDFRADRRERLRIALVMIGCGLLRRNTEGGVRSCGRRGDVSRGGAENAELGGSGGERKTLNVQR